MNVSKHKKGRSDVVGVPKKIYSSLAVDGQSLGSITRRCSGKEPALLPRTHGSRGFGIQLLISTNKNLACRSRAGSSRGET